MKNFIKIKDWFGSNFFQLTNNIDYKNKRVLRVIVEFKNGNMSCGSGFFINKEGDLFTCFHVVFGGELSKLRKEPEFIAIQGNNEHERLQKWFDSKIKKVSVELSNKSRVDLMLEKFDEAFDLASLKIENLSAVPKLYYCNIDFKKTLKQDDCIFFAGFPTQFSYKIDEVPLAVHTGNISCFPNTIIGGDIYEHIQVNSINLGGNSGAPLFLKNSNKVIGIVNGNMNYGADNLAFVENNGSIAKNSFRIPLSIAYCTSFKLLKKKSSIFRSFSNARDASL